MSGEFLPVMDFGIRSVPPCEDCWEDGHCSMNCGSDIKKDAVFSAVENMEK